MLECMLKIREIYEGSYYILSEQYPNKVAAVLILVSSSQYSGCNSSECGIRINLSSPRLSHRLPAALLTLILSSLFSSKD